MKGTGNADLGRPRMSVMKRNEAIAGYVFMLPLLLGIVFLTYGQFVYSLIISFTDKSVFGTANFVGLQNYVKLLREDFFFWKSIKATMLYAFGSVVATQLTALAIAILLSDEVPGVARNKILVLDGKYPYDIAALNAVLKQHVKWYNIRTESVHNDDLNLIIEVRRVKNSEALIKAIKDTGAFHDVSLLVQGGAID